VRTTLIRWRANEEKKGEKGGGLIFILVIASRARREKGKKLFVSLRKVRRRRGWQKKRGKKGRIHLSARYDDSEMNRRGKEKGKRESKPRARMGSTRRGGGGNTTLPPSCRGEKEKRVEIFIINHWGHGVR